MESNKGDKETLENVVKFMDSVSKALEGLKDKISNSMQEIESKNEKPDRILHEWVSQTNNIIKEKFVETFETVLDDNKNFNEILKVW